MASEPMGRPRARRWIIAGALAAAGVAIVVVAIVVGRARRAGSEDLVIVEGVRKVCKLSAIEVSVADYARRTVPKTIDLPFTHEPEAYLFYQGVVSVGFDVCDKPTRLDVDHASRLVRLTLPPARILSLDITRFETINERSGFLNAIAPSDRNGWYQQARKDLEAAALAQGALPKAEDHARELLGDFVSRWGYRLEITFEALPDPRLSPLEAPEGSLRR
jgi:hypothetical protein